jgi:class 3 adenylate cyclase
MNALWRIELLGGLRALRRGTPEPGTPAERGCEVDQVVSHFQTQKTGALLAYLAYYPQRPHRREELIELLWPEADLDSGRNRLSLALTWLRHQLEVTGTPQEPILIADRTAVRLNADAITTDVAEFQTALQAATRVGDTAERAVLLAQAVDLYRGPLLPHCYEEWVLREREWLAERYFPALRQLIASLESAGDLDRAIEYANRGVSADPLREEAHRELIRLYAAAGQPAAALRHFAELERLLKQELGSMPEAATRTLVREIERQSVLRQPATISPRAPVPPASPPAEGENRIVTVLFADMSHSVERTADLHPEDAAALLDRLLQAMVDVVLRYEGRIDKLLGDGLLAVFGVPQAHEDDAERAIRAALEIRAAARQQGLEVTAGINTGEVYVGGMGSEQHRELTVVGPIVNLASRLQGQAEPGQILVGEATFRQTCRAFTFRPFSLEIKGIARPVAAYAVARPLSRPQKARGIEGLQAELIGRDKELAQLQEALAETLQGRGQVVTLIGEAGLGKSRLVAELKLAAARGVTSPLWLEGRCLELNMTASYSLFVDLLRDAFAWQPEENDRARGERLVASLQAFVARQDLSAERVEEIGPLLGNLLSLRFGNEWDLRLKNAGPEQIKHQTFLAIRDFFLALARRQPVVLVCEDLHWADTLSLDLLPLLMESVTAAPILLLCIYRPEREHKCWRLGPIAGEKAGEKYSEIRLRELSPSQSRRLVASLLTIEELPESVKERILERARGNPFFVEEVVRSLIDAGLVYRETGEPRFGREADTGPTAGGAPGARGPAPGAGRSAAEDAPPPPPGVGALGRAPGVWRTREEIRSVTVPESVQSVILSRVDHLDRNTRHLLENASVIGRLFRRRVLEQMTGQNAWLEGAFWEAEERGLVYQERVVPEEEYSFKHVLTQETIYQSLVRRRRLILHEQVGQALEELYPEELDAYYEPLAYHYERSEAEEKAVEYLLKAGEKARRAYLNEEAIRYFQRALERLDGVRQGGGRGNGSTTQDPCSGPAVHSHPPSDLDADRRLTALRGLGQLYLGMGREPEAEERFRQAIVVAQEAGLAASEVVRLYFWLGDTLFWQSRSEEMMRVGEEGRALLGEDAESIEAALMNMTIAIADYQRGGGEKWRRFTSRNAAFLERLPYSEELRPVYLHLVILSAEDHMDMAEATRWSEALARRAEQHHDLRALASAIQFKAWHIRGPSGDLREAIAELQRALELFARIGDTKHEAQALAVMGLWFLRLGDLERAETYARRAYSTRRQTAGDPYLGWLELRLGTVSLCRGSLEEAAEAFQRAAQLLGGVQMGGGSEAALALVRVCLARGERQEALEQSQAAVTGARANPPLLAVALGALEEAYEQPAELSGTPRCAGAPPTHSLREFQAFCRRFREEHPELGASPFVQWFLEPAEPSNPPTGALPTVYERFGGPLSSDWIWHDPFGDGSFQVENGLKIHAANGRDLWQINLSAPRLLRPAGPAEPGPGAMAVQTACRPVSGRGEPCVRPPAIGGLLLWKDPKNFLRLERGAQGAHEISFRGRIQNEELTVGRGRLPSERVSLRLEWLGDRVKALCSADEQEWFTLGTVAFPVEGPVQVGLHAIGQIDRTIYPGAYPDGTAIRFETFQLWCS